MVSKKLNSKLVLLKGPQVAWIASIFFVSVVFLLGGGSRADIASLPVLRPIGFAVLAFSLVVISIEEIRPYFKILFFLCALAILHIVQQIPLPMELNASLPGRSWISNLPAVAGLNDSYFPLNLTPSSGWNGFFALIIPFATLFLIIRLTDDGHHRLVYTLMLFAVAGLVIGMLQVISSLDTTFYTYKITNKGYMVGLFANRNHNAIFLALAIALTPLLLTRGFFSKFHPRSLILIWVLLLLALGISILITESRAGTIVGLIAFFFSAWKLFAFSKKKALHKLGAIKFRYLATGFAFLLALLVATSAFWAKGTGLSRIIGENPANDLRFEYYPIIWEMIWQYFPFGTGMGSFSEIFKMHEPDELLNLTYLNHAHNDILQLLLEGGLYALLLMVSAFTYVVYRIIKIIRGNRGSTSLFAQTGAVMVTILIASSIFDYPLRTPIMSMIAIIALVWMERPPHRKKKQLTGEQL
jgi:O-antigen ligase